MPVHDVSARYVTRIDAPPAVVYAALMATDFGRPVIVRVLMGVRLLPGLLTSPRATWERLVRPARLARGSLANLEHSPFILLEQRPPREIVLGITGKFWTLAATTVTIPPSQFRNPIATGLAQAAWSFEVTEAAGGSELATETRVRCADPTTLRRFRRYWRFVAPGSGMIRYAIMRQVRREAMTAHAPV